MTTISRDLIDSILTKTSDDVADSATTTLLAADADARPYVSYAALEVSAGTLSLEIGGRIVKDQTEASGPCLFVGNKNEAITVTADVTVATKRYAVTCGHLRFSGGSGASGDVDA
jgi:hypothetical protein